MIQIFEKPIGFHTQRETSLNCNQLHAECWKSIEGRFLNATNGFNLTTVDENNITLAGAYCSVHRKVPNSRLVFGRSFACNSDGITVKSSDTSTRTFSQQKIKCENGLATLSSGVEPISAMAATVLTLITLSVTLNPLTSL